MEQATFKICVHDSDPLSKDLSGSSKETRNASAPLSNLGGGRRRFKTCGFLGGDDASDL
jgi:hypothetical protein